MNAGLKTSLPGQEANRGLRVHYAGAWKEKLHSKRIKKSIPGSALYGLYKVRYYDTKRVWQITSLPPLLIRLFTKQQKVLLNILLCKGKGEKKKPVCSPHTGTAIPHPVSKKLGVCLTIFSVFSGRSQGFLWLSVEASQPAGFRQTYLCKVFLNEVKKSFCKKKN